MLRTGSCSAGALALPRLGRLAGAPLPGPGTLQSCSRLSLLRGLCKTASLSIPEFQAHWPVQQCWGRSVLRAGTGGPAARDAARHLLHGSSCTYNRHLVRQGGLPLFTAVSLHAIAHASTTHAAPAPQMVWDSRLHQITQCPMVPAAVVCCLLTPETASQTHELCWPKPCTLHPKP